MAVIYWAFGKFKIRRDLVLIKAGCDDQDEGTCRKSRVMLSLVWQCPWLQLTTPTEVMTRVLKNEVCELDGNAVGLWWDLYVYSCAQTLLHMRRGSGVLSNISC